MTLRKQEMLWLILEASAAFFIFVFIVWWTMFSGKKPEHQTPAITSNDKKDPSNPD
jgi:cytoskeletal protein RodZ